MNYRRIYDQLISDRRANPPSEDEYVEVHHILPRGMGGGDEPENLIRLRPEDHFFAHLLLAKIHNSREMWAAVVLMCGNRWREFPRARENYGMARRRLHEVSRGIDAPNADTNEYTFYHLDGDVFTGTRIDFGTYADVPAASVDRLVRGVGESAYGWHMRPKTRAEYTLERTERATRAGKMLVGFVRDKVLRHFYHKESDTSAIATQRGMREMFGLEPSAISGLISGQRAVSGGWCLLDNADWAYGHAVKSGTSNHRYNPKKIHLC